MKIHRVLVPTDFSPNAQLAFRAGYDLARATGAEMDLLHVQAESDLRSGVKENLVKPGSSTEAVRGAVEQLQDARFAQVIAGQDSEVPIRCVTARGDPDAAIVEYAQENNADLMIVGMRGSGAGNRIRAALLGSVAEAMLRKSPCPVLVIRSDHRI